MDKINRWTSDGRTLTVRRYASTAGIIDNKLKVIEVTISHLKAGASMWTYQPYPSGIRLSFRVIDISYERGFEVVCFEVGTGTHPGCYWQIDNSERFNRKAILALAENEAVISAHLKEFIEKYNLGTVEDWQ